MRAVRIALGLLGPERPRTVLDVFRLWRVAYLAGVLRPDSATPKDLKARFRRYSHELERLPDD